MITAAGIFAAVLGHFPILRTGWIFWSIVLFTISGLVFGFKVAPIQKRIQRLTVDKNNLSEKEWLIFQNYYRQWDIWGVIAILTPLIAFIMMILKTPQ